MPERRIYSAKDFERYYNGSMTPAEMHALEKDALDDHFLQDALDGYALSSSPVKEIENVKERFSKREKRKRSPVIFPLLRAASVILILASGWFIYNNSKKKDSSGVEITATEKTTPILQEPGNRIIPQTEDSLVIVRNENQELPVANNEDNDAEISIAEMASAQPDSTREYFYEKTQGQVSKGEFPLQGNMAGSETDAARSIRIQEIRQVPSTMNELKEKQVIASTPANTKIPDSVIADYIPGVKTESLSEVVITAATSARKKNRQYRTQPVQKELIEHTKRVTVTNAVPLNGWQQFEEYTNKNLKTLLQVDSQSVNSVIRLTFKLNEKGEPVNVKSQKSACKKCVEEAIRFIKSSPPFRMNIKNKKAIAVIRF